MQLKKNLHVLSWDGEDVVKIMAGFGILIIVGYGHRPSIDLSSAIFLYQG